MPVAQETPQRAPQRRKKERQGSDVTAECERACLDSCSGHPSRVGRCRCSRPDGTVMAVPLAPHVLCSGLHDDMHELVVVEMRAPLGDQCWLDDDQVNFVQVECGAACHVLERLAVRAFVTQRVPFSHPTRNLARSIYKLCAPLEEPQCQLLVSLVPAADLVAACAPPPAATASESPPTPTGTSVSP